MPSPRRMLLCAALVAFACANPDLLRDGIALPYESAADSDLRAARLAIEDQRPEDAQLVLERFLGELRSSRRAAEGLQLLGEVYLSMGQPERAALVWRRLLERHPRSQLAAETRIRVAQLYRDLGRPEVGRRILAAAAFRRADASVRAQMHRLLADLARAAGDYPEAVRSLAYARRDTESPDALIEIDLELSELIADRLRDSQLHSLAERLPRGPVYDRLLLEQARRANERGDFAAALQTLGKLPRRLHPSDEYQREKLQERATHGAETADYTIGLAVPLSGPYAAFGESVLRGVILALDPFSEEPGRFQLLLRDTAGDPAEQARVIRELADAGARAVIGPMRSVVAAAAAPIAAEVRIPMLTLAQSDDLPMRSRYVFRLGLTASEQVHVLTAHAIDCLGARSFALLYPRDEYGTSFKNLFWDEVERRGGSVVGVEGYQPDSVDLQAEIRKLVGLHYLTDEERELLEERDQLRRRPLANAERLADPNMMDLPPYVDFDALFIPEAARSVGLILPQLRFYDIRDVTLLGPRDWNEPKLIEIAGRDAEGVVFVDAFSSSSEDPVIQEFVDRFRTRFGREPDVSAAEGYDAGAVLRALVDKVGHPSSERLRLELLDLRGFVGVSGLTAFDESGVPEKRIQLLTVRRGRVRGLIPSC